MRDVPSGWCLRYMHANGASLFFIVVYLHVFRGMYYSSYARPRELVWIIGVIILLLMIMTAFIGYLIGLKWLDLYFLDIYWSFCHQSDNFKLSIFYSTYANDHYTLEEKKSNG
jgi:ABC-type transport system involved in multi-copper enzyme maturation permease subunit